VRIERNLGEGEVAESQGPLGLEAYYAAVAVKVVRKEVWNGVDANLRWRHLRHHQSGQSVLRYSVLVDQTEVDLH
jgi:hypothetical protein